MFNHLNQIESFINNSTLDMKLLELVRTRVSQKKMDGLIALICIIKN